MSVEVEQDHSRPDGGYALLRFEGAVDLPPTLTLRFTGMDDSTAPSDANWQAVGFRPVSATSSNDLLEVIVGPDVVNVLPADTPLRIDVDELGISEVCWWPPLTPEVVGPRGRMTQLERAQVAVPERPARAAARQPARNQAATQEPRAVQAPVVETPAAAEPAPVAPNAEAVQPEIKSGIPANEPTSLPGGSVVGSRTTDPVVETVPNPPRKGRVNWGLVAASFVAGALIGAGALHFALPKEDVLPPPAELSDHTLLRAVDTPDFDEAGNWIFATASREWLRQADLARANGKSDLAPTLYKRAIRAGFYERRQENGDAIGRLAAVLSTDTTAAADFEATVRILVALSVIEGDVNALCNLAKLNDMAVGGPKDAEFAQQMRARAQKAATAAGSSSSINCE